MVRKRPIVFELAGIQIFMQGVELMLAAAQRKINDVGVFEDGDVAEFNSKRLAITAFGGQATDGFLDIQLERPGGQDSDVRPQHAAGL
jgi:hypothetical protein